MRWKKLIALLAVLTLFAAACGSDDDGDDASTSGTDSSSDDSGTDDSGTDDSGTDDTATDDSGTDDSGTDDAGTDDAGTDDAMAGQGGELILLQWQAPSQANTLLSSGTKDIQAGSLVLEPMAWIDPAGVVVPALAAEIPTVANGGISEDGTQITWRLQEGLVWSDGTPVTSEDAVFTWEYCTDEATGCSTENFSSVDTVVADDELTFTVTFESPQPFPFVPYVTAQGAIIQKAQMAECIGEAAKACSEQNFMPVGTGPYMVTELRPEDTVTYEYNPNYRGASQGLPFFGNVTIKGGGSAEDAARSVLEVGDADYGWNLQVAPEILAGMEAAGNGRLASAFASSVEHISLNQTDNEADPPSEGTPHPLFVDNPDLQRALSIAIDRDALVQVGYGPTGAPTCNMWPVGAENSTNNDFCLTRDVDAANALLDGLGYEDTDGDGIREAPGYGPLSFEYVTSTNAVRQSNQEIVKDNWSDIGVEAILRDEDSSLFFDGTCASDVCIWKFPTPIQMYTNNAPNPDGVDYLGNFLSEKIPTSATAWGGDNIYRYNNPDFDAKHAAASQLALDDPARVEAIIEMNDMVSTSAVIPLIYRASASAFGNDIQNVGELNGWDTEYWNIQEWTRG